MARGGGDAAKPNLADLDDLVHAPALTPTREVTRFVATVDLGDESRSELTTIWLAELGLMGSGANLREARVALLESLGAYLDDFASDERARAHAERSGVAGLLQRALAARNDGELDKLVFGD